MRRPVRQIAVHALVVAAAMLAAPNAMAAEPPPCDDVRVLAQIRLAYDDAVDTYQLKRLAAIESPQQLAVVERPPSLDTAKNRIMFGGYPWSRSRFCQASLKLEAGSTDSVHYRIDGLKNGPEDQYELTPCFDGVLEHEYVPREEYALSPGYQ